MIPCSRLNFGGSLFLPIAEFCCVSRQLIFAIVNGLVFLARYQLILRLLRSHVYTVIEIKTFPRFESKLRAIT